MKLPFAASDLAKLTQVFIGAFPVMNVNDQKLALMLYRLLAEGEPVALTRLANALDRTVDNVKKTLGGWPGVFHDDDERIVGFWGISVKETRHRLEVNGKTVYAWCAWDTLFLPELLRTTVHVASRCPDTGMSVRLVVSPENIESVQPAEAVVSFLVPDETELRANITTSFCHFVHFFRDRIAGEHWVAAHEGTLLLTLQEAFVIGSKMNRTRYKDALGQVGVDSK